MELQVDEQPPPVRPARVGWPWWLFRSTLTVQSLDAFLQAVFAGRFLAGQFGMLDVHQLNATIVGVVSFVQIVVAVLAWRTTRTRPGFVAATVLISAAIIVQIVLGYYRTLGLHVPLGVVIIVGTVWLTIWAWTQRPAARS